MRSTAQWLERSEDALHRRADEARDSRTAERLDALGDKVTPNRSSGSAAHLLMG